MSLQRFLDALVYVADLARRLADLLARVSTAVRPPKARTRYGWRPQIPDARDRSYVAATDTAALPPSVDLRATMPLVYDQGQLGSCTANAIGAALEFDQYRQGETAQVPSRLFIYWHERQIEGTVGTDSGAQIRDGMKVVANIGAPPEVLWPYVIRRFRTRPSKKAEAAAPAHRAVEYRAVDQTLDGIRQALADGTPVVFGFTVYESFESQAVAQTGRVPMPRPGERVLGGHAVLVAGYDDTTGYFLVRNSWGDGWGAGGYCTMPYGYLTDPSLASDFWTIQQVA